MNVKSKKEVKNGSVVMTLSDGENLKNKVVKRGYLRADEMSNFMMIHVVHQLIEGFRSQSRKTTEPMWDTWEKSGVITKEQKKNLKMACTYMKKFTSSVFNDNLDVKTKDNIVKKNYKWDIKLMDDYTLKRVYTMLQNNKEIKLTTDEFYDLIEAKHALHCRGCKKNRSTCDIQTFFENHLVPTVADREPESLQCNCEYAFYEG